MTERLAPTLEKFKRVSPKTQRKYLARLDEIAGEQTDEFLRDVTLWVRNLFAENAHKTETTNETAADLEDMQKAQTEIFAELPKVRDKR